MNRKSSKPFIVSVMAVVLLSLSLFVAVARAQYGSEQTTNVTLGSDGVAHVAQNSAAGEISIDITGKPGSTGSVSTATYLNNPQPEASVPANTALAHFVVVTFDMPASEFQGANIIIHYNPSDLAGINPPYVLYKYVPSSNSYVQLDAVVDINAHTVITSVSSTTDPLFAIGGVPVVAQSSMGGSAVPWVYVAIVCVIGVLVVVLLLRRREPTFEVIK